MDGRPLPDSRSADARQPRTLPDLEAKLCTGRDHGAIRVGTTAFNPTLPDQFEPLASSAAYVHDRRAIAAHRLNFR